MENAIELLEEALQLVGGIEGEHRAAAGRVHWRIETALELLRALTEAEKPE